MQKEEQFRERETIFLGTTRASIEGRILLLELQELRTEKEKKVKKTRGSNRTKN